MSSHVAWNVTFGIIFAACEVHCLSNKGSGNHHMMFSKKMNTFEDQFMHVLKFSLHLIRSSYVNFRFYVLRRNLFLLLVKFIVFQKKGSGNHRTKFSKK